MVERWADSQTSTLRTRTEMVFETFVCSPLNHLTWLIAQENFIILSRRESNKSHFTRQIWLWGQNRSLISLTLWPGEEEETLHSENFPQLISGTICHSRTACMKFGTCDTMPQKQNTDRWLLYLQ
jgi:hypothetical protein